MKYHSRDEVFDLPLNPPEERIETEYDPFFDDPPPPADPLPVAGPKKWVPETTKVKIAMAEVFGVVNARNAKATCVDYSGLTSFGF